MSPEKLFGELLGLGLSWRVAECVFSRAEGRVDLRVENTEEVWKSERCPRCGGLSKAYDHTEEVHWDHQRLRGVTQECVHRRQTSLPRLPIHGVSHNHALLRRREAQAARHLITH